MAEFVTKTTAFFNEVTNGDFFCVCSCFEFVRKSIIWWHVVAWNSVSGIGEIYWLIFEVTNVGVRVIVHVNIECNEVISEENVI